MINLCFHGIGTPGRTTEPGEDPYWISADFFPRVLDLVVGRNDVALSFDDGNASDLALGLPGLQDRGLRATFFVVASRLDQTGSLGRDDLRGLREQGMTIGSHGMAHVPWRGLRPEQQETEFTTARERLAEACGAPVDEAALPLGRYDAQVLRSLRTKGYRAVHTSDRAPARRPDQWLRPRYSVTAADDLASVRSILSGPSRVAAVRMRTKMLIKARRPGSAPR